MVATTEPTSNGVAVSMSSAVVAKSALEAGPKMVSRGDGSPAEPVLEPGTQEWALHEPVTAIDSRDADTPDRWVPRHPSLIRLTGRHPFNVEPPLTESYPRGFITPVSLHFVRNHGAVPQLRWDSHTITVNGLVDKPMTLTMDDLLRLPTHDVTCTLVCAGNRRKEQNMVKKTIGFNWGHSATSCTTWTGVRMSDLLRMAGVKSAAQGAKYVCFRGIKGELPQGDDGSYGTSLLLTKAMDPANDVLIAYKQNGRLLTPDHGYPVRIIIPGHIGGRMVKYLEEITVTEKESDSFYHYFDNRVLPSHVDPELAKKEGWWYKEDFVINDLNINSAIAYPAHEEVVPLSQSTYNVKGYAYSGGGRKIIRAEISLDDGVSWRLTNIQLFEKPTTYGRYWCWVHWNIDVPMVDLLKCKEVICRAWDESMNTQPNTFTWNVMGMMNNCVFRVKVHPVASAQGALGLRFEHPTVAGPTPGGWMNPEQPAATDIEVPKAVPPPPGSVKLFTMEEVEKHVTKGSAWFVHSGKVYDATPYLKDHPGGAESILIVAGQDATEEFDAIHSIKAKGLLAQYYIGDLATEETAAAPANGHANGHTNGEAVAPVALDPRKKIPFKLIEKHELSHNVRRFRFALQSPQHRFGLPVGKHVFLSARVNDALVMRAYTPASSDDDLGYFDLVIKVYWANEHPRFPEGGKMSQHLETLKIGDTIDVKGPLGHFDYKGNGNFLLSDEPKHVRRISMIAGGTGITPMYQVIKAVLKNKEDQTELSLLYANQSPDDILLREELDTLAADHPNFNIWYTVDRADDGWQFSTGFVCEELLRERLFPSAPDTVCVMCGPPPMINFACLPNLEKLGYTKEQCIQF